MRLTAYKILLLLTASIATLAALTSTMLGLAVGELPMTTILVEWSVAVALWLGWGALPNSNRRSGKRRK